MPSLTYKDIQAIAPFQTTTFVETGTWLGDTVHEMIPYYKNIYSIELSEHYCAQAKTRFAKNSNVHILQGDSSKELLTLCITIQEPTVFWLDGHWSSGDTAKGEKDCPLMEELKTIVTYFRDKAVIIIDDVRLFGTKENEDWSHISLTNVIAIVKPRLTRYFSYPSVYSPIDRLVLVLE